MNKTEAWYWGNIQLIAHQMPDATIRYDDTECRWIMIDPLPLPDNVYQDYSKLLIVLPGINKPIQTKPNGFYLDRGLKHHSGRSLDHIYNKGAYHDCEDLSSLGFAWFCLILKQWNPSYNVVDGDNYATVINTIFQQLKTL